MGRRRTERYGGGGGAAAARSQTLPSSPTHSSSSSSDFEFTISVSPRKSSHNLCHADELFYKGQLLPLHLSPRISMVRTLLLSSSSTSSSSTDATRDSSGSSTDSHYSCDSSRPSSVAAEDDEFKRLTTTNINNNPQIPKKPAKYFSFSRFSSVFRKEPKTRVPEPAPGSGSGKQKMGSVSAKEVIRKYLGKVKPLYEKLSQQKQQQQQKTIGATNLSFFMKTERSNGDIGDSRNQNGRSTKEEGGNNNNNNGGGGISHSFSGNLRYPRRRTRSCVSSCPSSMRSSPTHSGILGGYGGDSSSMEELQSAIQGAIAHCKNSMNIQT